MRSPRVVVPRQSAARDRSSTALSVIRLAAQAAAALENARLYQALRDSEERAREADRRKDEFLALLGHELRTPLAPIVTALHLLRRRGGAGDRERRVIERQVTHLVGLVDDLLDVSRIARGKVTLHRRLLDLSEVIGRAIEMASPLIEQRTHVLRVSVPAGELHVHGDERRLAQVVANLLTNAAKYTPPQGHVELSAAREGREIVIHVRGDGIGIAPDLLPRLFEPFVQGARHPARSERGLGLGLTIVRTMVELHGGRVAARSRSPERGSAPPARRLGHGRYPPRRADGLRTGDGSGARSLRRVRGAPGQADPARGAALDAGAMRRGAPLGIAPAPLGTNDDRRGRPARRARRRRRPRRAARGLLDPTARSDRSTRARAERPRRGWT